MYWRSVVILLAVSVLLRLPWLSHPAHVVFDEVHFGKFVTAYCCSGERFFDIHPPHAKLIIAGAAWLGGYRGGFSFSDIGQEYGDVPVVALRLVPALFGTLLPIVFYWVLRELGVAPRFAFLGGWFVTFDNALVVQSRLMSLDMVLLVAQLVALAAWLRGRQRRTGWRWFLLGGAAAGLAVGTKFTGLAVVALLGVLTLWSLIRERAARAPVWIGRAAVMGVVAVLVYALGWWAHWQRLPLPGPGDDFLVPARIEAGAGLIGMLRDTIDLHRVMLSANYGLTASHPDTSPWWSWPLMTTAVYYWEGAAADGGTAPTIYLLGNPLVWWGSTAAASAAVLGALLKLRQWWGSWQMAPLAVSLVGYVTAMGPLVAVPRVLFLYHYFTPLLYALAAALVWLQPSRLAHARLWGRWLPLGLVGVVVVFIFFSPLTYGLPVPSIWQAALFWLPTWK